MKDINTVNSSYFITKSHNKGYSNDNTIAFKHIIRAKGFNIKKNRFTDNIMLFHTSGKMKIGIKSYGEYYSNSNTIIFIPAKSYFYIKYVETSEMVIVRFGTLHQPYSLRLFQILTDGKRRQHIFPALHMNDVIHEYINDVKTFITNPINKECKCEVYEDDFFIVFGVYYRLDDLANLFFPVFNNPELIK